MQKEIVRIVGGWVVNLASFSFGFMKGWFRARNKLKKDNKHFNDTIDD